VVAGASTEAQRSEGAGGLAGEAEDDLVFGSGDGDFWATSYWSSGIGKVHGVYFDVMQEVFNVATTGYGVTS
jgi:hypothetical protein